jgi:hypothetical protein
LSGLKNVKNRKQLSKTDYTYKPGDDVIYLGKVKETFSAQEKLYMLQVAESERFFVIKIVNPSQIQLNLENRYLAIILFSLCVQ